jgi:hypothetical protein
MLLYPILCFSCRYFLKLFLRSRMCCLGCPTTSLLLASSAPAGTGQKGLRVSVPVKHVIAAALGQARGMPGSFIREFVAWDTCLGFHFLQVDVVWAGTYEVNKLLYESLVFAIGCHCCHWSVQHVADLVLHCCTRQWQSLRPVPLVRHTHMAAPSALVIDSWPPACTCSRVKRDCHSILVFIPTCLECSVRTKSSGVLACCSQAPTPGAHITFSRLIVESPGHLQCPWLTTQCMSWCSTRTAILWENPFSPDCMEAPDHLWTIQAGG